MLSVNDIGAIVSDIGSFATRIGYAGDDLPKAYLPSLTGVSGSDSSKKEYLFDLSNFHQNVSVESPLRDGVIHDWDMFESLWEYSIRNFVKADLIEAPVLMSEKTYNPSSNRQKLCEIMFEKYNIPAFFVSKDAALSCYALGKTTGLVMDAGANGTTMTPILDGWAETRNINRSFIGGRYIDSYVISLLKSKGIDPIPLFRLIKTVTQDKRILVTQNPSIVNIHPSYDAFMRLEIGRDLKESTCRMAESILYEGDTRYMNIPLIPYELPDGTIIDLGIERFQIPELFCDASVTNNGIDDLKLLGFGMAPQVTLYPQSFESIPRLICDSIMKSEPEYQSALFSSIIITGGSSRFEGMPDRIKYEIENIIYSILPTLRIKTFSAGPSERGLCAWLGGSILASLGSFHEMWISKQEYDEYGSAIIDKKCP